jgi:ribonuclease HI
MRRKLDGRRPLSSLGGRRMEEETFVGLDVHKRVVVATAVDQWGRQLSQTRFGPSDASLNQRRSERSLSGVLLSFAGGGIVLRDPRLTVLESLSVALGLVPSPTHAEYVALLAGLSVARAHRVEHLRIRNDNISLVRRLTGEPEGVAEDLLQTVQEIGALQAEFQTFDLRWAPSTHTIRRRDGALSADHLARVAAGLGLRTVHRGGRHR